MGNILGRFRKQKTTLEQLEKIDSQIRSIEEYGKNTEIEHKRIAGRFVLVSVFVYLLTACIFYFYFLPASVYERLFYIIPLVLAPAIIISVKRILTWWYNRKLKKNRTALVTLKDKKKKMLDTVMDTETYKVAKTILEKFAPEEMIKKSSSTNLEPYAKVSSPYAAINRSQTATGLRYRGGSLQLQPLALTGKASFGNDSTPPASRLMQQSSSLTLVSGAQGGFGSPQGTPSGPLRLPMPRTLPARDRTVLDRMVDYLVGDGPSNRYALICTQCSSHNGMALREEFDYLSFRCCYCFAFNPARKQRPAAPKLEITTSPSKLSDTSDSERNSPSDSESESDNNTLLLKSCTDTDAAKITDTEKVSSIETLSDIEMNNSHESSPIPSENDNPESSENTEKTELQ